MLCETGAHLKMSKVSVIIPVYNVERYLGECLDSILGQTLKDIEVICVNDGSVDSSLEILNSYASRDPRIKVFSQPNSGAGAARNAGLDRATGEWLFFGDPDDWCSKSLLGSMVGRGECLNADVVISGHVPVCAETEIMGEPCMPHQRWPTGEVFAGSDVSRSLFNISRHTIWDKLFRRSHVVGNRIRFQETKRFNDMLFCDLSLACARRLVLLREAGYCHRVGRQGGLQRTKRETPYLIVDVYRRYREELDARNLMPVYWKSVLRMVSGQGGRIAASYCWSMSRVGLFARLLIFLLSVNPHSVMNRAESGHWKCFLKSIWSLVGFSTGLKKVC